MRMSITAAFAGVVLALAGQALASAERLAPQQPDHPLPVIVSGYAFMGVDLRALQDDPFQNPGQALFERGAQHFRAPDGRAVKACANCHAGERPLDGVAARFPAYDASLGRVIGLEERINLCRTRHQGASPWAWESPELLGTTSFVRHQSQGRAIGVDVTGPAAPAFEAGRALYATRLGQLRLSCAQCHDERYGKALRAERISQGHPNGFPAYRIGWRGVGSLHRRMADCNAMVRAEPFPAGSEAYIHLELYLAWRAQGLKVESPAVRP